LPKERTDKIFSYLLLVGIFFSIFIWSTVKQNVDADVTSLGARISFLDVGEGDAALINLPKNRQILIDTGKSGKLLGKLQDKMPAFDREIDAVFLTHPDSDHIGGFSELAQSYKIGKVYSSAKKSDSATAKKVEEVIKQKNIPSEIPREGQSIYFNSFSLRVLWSHDGAATLSSNDSSLVLKAEADQSKALFLGDIEIKGQQALLAKESDLSADLLKVSHHGSAGAYDERFLKKVGAKNSVISVGPNSYGHPAKSVIEGLENLAVKVFRTDELGTIDFVPSDVGWVRK